VRRAREMDDGENLNWLEPYQGAARNECP
jgi:hypothetical protein